MRISGHGGHVRAGYQTAAVLGPWTLTRLRTTPAPLYEATATIRDADAFWIAHRPLDLELVMGQRAWTWTQVDPRIEAQSLAVTLDGVPLIH